MSRRAPESLFSSMAQHAAKHVMTEYSTSFSIATKLLPLQMRTDIRNLYAVVRIADEIVDGAASALSAHETAVELRSFRNAVLRGIEIQFSANPIIHAFAQTVQRCDIQIHHIKAFFQSMETDVQRTTHTPESRAEYIYGSAEVIGLMCLAIFTAEHPLRGADQGVAKRGAQALGAAFQNINFLRDFAIDHERLGRNYISPNGYLDDVAKAQLIAEIREDLATAHTSIPLLPIGARTGVLTAYYLFSELTERLDAAPVEVITARRIRVPGRVKAKLTTRAIATAPRLRPTT
ncbi:MAG: squalene/phytoene synthase family protein [Corynebacterium sp.]|nr:squalene/phytoene synthase family protein [Corynebacterium sp.]